MYLNPWWIIGFICGEGSFTYGKIKYNSKLLKNRNKYNLLLEISQNNKNMHVLYAIYSFFGVGYISKDNKNI